VILTDAGEPVAKIVPVIHAHGSREFGSSRGMIEMVNDFDSPLEDFGDYR
jgi:antitoxin (DNA-binding transcriptional repressor) of toxin-antitoxin stability system